jgi:hypothetical protein
VRLSWAPEHIHLVRESTEDPQPEPTETATPQGGN